MMTKTIMLLRDRFLKSLSKVREVKPFGLISADNELTAINQNSSMALQNENPISSAVNKTSS